MLGLYTEWLMWMICVLCIYRLADQNTTLQKMKDLLSRLPDAHITNLKSVTLHTHTHMSLTPPEPGDRSVLLSDICWHFSMSSLSIMRLLK